MRMSWKTYVVAGVSALALCGAAVMTAGAASSADTPPKYQYDPNWPKELPNKWMMQGVTGMFVDQDDHVWVLNRPRDITPREALAATNPPVAECCVQSPAVMEFDADGNLLRAWGKPNEVPGWPQSEHTIFVDRAHHV